MTDFKFKDVICVGFLPEILDIKFSINTDYIELILQSDVRCVLLSFKNVKEISLVGLDLAINALEFIRQRSKKSIGFCDYDEETFEFIIKTKKLINLSLFENIQIAWLLYSINNQRVIAYVDDEQQCELLFYKLTMYSNFVKIVKNKERFDELKQDYKLQITSKTRIKSGQKPKLYEKDGAIVYCLDSIIHSEFVDSFDIDEFNRMLKVGFKIFTFSLGSAPTLGLYAANFLSKISKIAFEYNAVISICGIGTKHISPDIIAMIKKSNIYLYDSINAFFDDDSIIYADVSNADFPVAHVTKQIVTYVPEVIKCVIASLDFVYDVPILYDKTQIRSYELPQNQSVALSIMYFGSINFRLVLTLQQPLANKLSQLFFDDNNNSRLCFYGLLNIISSKITSFFETKNIILKPTMPRIYINEDFYDTKSIGAFVKFEISRYSGSLYISA
ncbi:hypothetical protein LMG7974_01786 [Campylobacter majalis]|uniref:Uncharacterized protein n=1 Tax=Campylobacter majalis TaxID=2790656 RepID=A0ABN7KB10_9BACT|nr:hypothetical protein [Campylobacter majalis]CAD7289708.1 hypothetical protein LMG7974_01786 [Campylobacter majalis]